MARLGRNIVRIDDPDAPIYRWFQLPHFWSMIEDRQFMLVPPGKWEDPFEDFPRHCMVDYEGSPHRIHTLDSVIDPVYAQCWSMTEESDALWRAYSRVVKQGGISNTCPDEEGVQVRTTPRKLLQVMWKWCPDNPAKSCFIGKVRYLNQQEVVRHIDEVLRGQLDEVSTGVSRAELVLFKRSGFSHEAEVRLVYVRPRTDDSPPNTIAIPFNPDRVFDQVSFDPRLEEFESDDRKKKAKQLGFNGSFGGCELYDHIRWIVTKPI